VTINIESHNAEKANNVVTGDIIVSYSQERVQRSEFKGYLRGKNTKGLYFPIWIILFFHGVIQKQRCEVYMVLLLLQ
jgi:hypothetical protein